MPYAVLFEADCGPVRFEGLTPRAAVRILETILRSERSEARSFRQD